MIAIHTKYLPATNSSGSRIKAYTARWGEFKGYSVKIPYNDALDEKRAHFEAVKALIKKHNLDWNLENMRYGDSADGRGFCFCFDNSIV